MLRQQKIPILLRSRWAIIGLVVLLIVGSVSFPASAANNDTVEYFNYRDYETAVTVDGDMDIVTINFPIDLGYGSIANSTWQTVSTWTGSNSPRVWLEAGYYHFMVNPFGDNTYLSLGNIPDDAKFTLRFGLTGFSTNTDWSLEWVRMFERYIKDDVVTRTSFYVNRDSTGEADLIEFGTSDAFSRGYDGYAPEYDLYVYIPSARNCYMDVYEFSCTLSINSYYRVLDEMGYTEQIDELRQELESQGKQLDDILDQQQQTNDKLDALPGQIGDEMQGIIDSEKDEANSEGNKFVDQILDALPDPSTDVLAALKSLTDATAYTGTDAVLPIPAVVLPGIEGLFPETEIWGGTDLDLGEYITLLPPTLLTLVQSLFTIAIVLYCVYELKGIISYCLTLRESKGG